MVGMPWHVQQFLVAEQFQRVMVRKQISSENIGAPVPFDSTGKNVRYESFALSFAWHGSNVCCTLPHGCDFPYVCTAHDAMSKL